MLRSPPSLHKLSHLISPWVYEDAVTIPVSPGDSRSSKSLSTQGYEYSKEVA